MEIIDLPPPNLKGKMSLEECLSKRRSVRSFQDKRLSLQQLSQILWSAAGITEKRRGFRTSPSAGATFPIEIYATLPDGFFYYDNLKHAIEKKNSEDLRKKLAKACLGQEFIAEAGLSVIISATYERTTAYYGKRGIRYVDMEAGHIAQNIHLQAISLGLASVPVGAFHDEEVRKVLELRKEEQPIYIIVVGYPK